MHIYNIKINSKALFKIIIISIIVISLLILFFSLYNIWHNSNFYINDTLNLNNITNIESNEYTKTLKTVYDNIDSYIGKNINFTGYIFKLYDLKNSEFILARDMLINSDSQSVVVGFLCTYENADKYKEGTWVNITGTIIKGYYHNEIPVIDISEIKEVEEPEDSFVYPPEL